MNFDLESHVPDDGARRRAESAGLDLEVLRRDEPVTYMMICSLPVLRAAPELEDLAEPVLDAVFGDQQLFKAEAEGKVLVLAFPGPTQGQLRRFDELMGEAVEAATEEHAYYRIVNDRSGTSRELDLPTPPELWRGSATMVGPFENEAEAQGWAQRLVVPQPGMTYDALLYAGAWFCDVFSAAELEA